MQMFHISFDIFPQYALQPLPFDEKQPDDTTELSSKSFGPNPNKIQPYRGFLPPD